MVPHYSQANSKSFFSGFHFANPLRIPALIATTQHSVACPLGGGLNVYDKSSGKYNVMSILDLQGFNEARQQFALTKLRKSISYHIVKLFHGASVFRFKSLIVHDFSFLNFNQLNDQVLNDQTSYPLLIDYRDAGYIGLVSVGVFCFKRQLFIKTILSNCTGDKDPLFTTYAKFSEKLIFLKCQFFGKFCVRTEWMILNKYQIIRMTMP